jgi:Berberine and berberine like
MCNALRRDRLPDRRVIIRFDFTGRPRRERYWLLIEYDRLVDVKTTYDPDNVFRHNQNIHSRAMTSISRRTNSAADAGSRLASSFSDQNSKP